MKIFVKTSHDEIELEGLFAWNSIYDLKQALHDKIKKPVNWMRLFWQGQEMSNNNRLLNDWHIGDGTCFGLNFLIAQFEALTVHCLSYY